MAKIIGKSRKTWKDGSVMTYTVTDEGVLTISGSLRDGCLVPFKSKAPFRHVVIADGIESVGNKIECEIKGEDGVNYIGTICNIKTDRAWASIRPADKIESDREAWCAT